MTRIPIYQMTFGQNQNGEGGLIFTTEQEEYSSQSIVFTIPVRDNLNNHFDIFDYVERYTFYFPFFTGEKYIEIEGKINFPELVFNVPDTDFKIKFEIQTDYYFDLHFHPFRPRYFRKQKYVGKSHNQLFKDKSFITLLPVDLYEMNELYEKHKGFFVGLTPNFGNIENESNFG